MMRILGITRSTFIRGGRRPYQDAFGTERFRRRRVVLGLSLKLALSYWLSVFTQSQCIDYTVS